MKKFFSVIGVIMTALMLTVISMAMAFAEADGQPVPGADVLDSIIKALASAEGASLTIALVLEFIFRVVPSNKPLSILHMVAGFLMIADVLLVKASQIVKSAAKILDKVLPQNIAKESLK